MKEKFMPKKINNLGFSVIHLFLILSLSSIVGLIFYSYINQITNKDTEVLQSNTNKPLNLNIFIDRPSVSLNVYDVKFVFDIIDNPKNINALNNLKMKIKSKGLVVEYFCDSSPCSNSKKVEYPKLDEFTNGFSVRLSSVDQKLKSVRINDSSILTNELKVKVNSPSGLSSKWAIDSSQLGIFSTNDTLEITGIIPTSNSIRVKFKGDGEVYWNFISSVKSNGVKLTDCFTSITDCRNSTYFVRNIENLDNNQAITINIKNTTKLVTFNLNSMSMLKTRWMVYEVAGWKVTSDRLSIENINFAQGIVPKVSIKSSRETSSSLRFTIVVSGNNSDSVMKSLRAGVLYKSANSNTIKRLNLTIVGAGIYEIILPDDTKSITFINPPKINFTQIPSGWIVNSSATGIERR